MITDRQKKKQRYWEEKDIDYYGWSSYNRYWKSQEGKRYYKELDGKKVYFEDYGKNHVRIIFTGQIVRKEKLQQIIDRLLGEIFIDSV